MRAALTKQEANVASPIGCATVRRSDLLVENAQCATRMAREEAAQDEPRRRARQTRVRKTNRLQVRLSAISAARRTRSARKPVTMRAELTSNPSRIRSLLVWFSSMSRADVARRSRLDIFSRSSKTTSLLRHADSDQIANLIVAQLLFLEAEDREGHNLYINSPAARSPRHGLYDTMQFLRPDVTTICVGQCPRWRRCCWRGRKG